MLKTLPSVFVFCLLLLSGTISLGQPQPSGEVPPEIRAKMEEARAKAQAANQPAGKPPKPGDEKKEEGKDGKEKDGEKSKDDSPKPVTRPDKPKQSPNPEELKVGLDEEGLLQFQFHGQPWPAVIQWYSEVSGKAIDWRELPGDYLNVRTQRPYSLDETRDLINRHLLARGYTLLYDDEFLTVEKAEGINTALVPRVKPDGLEELMPHDFVKTSFKLRRLLAEDLVKELEPMKSKNGKLTALASTNRIEAIDTVKNLREMHDVLEEEQTGGRVLEEFILKYVRAVDVREKLEELLGVQKKTPSMPMNPDQMRQMQQMQRQMQQQQKGQPQQKKKDEAPIRFIVNGRRNSVIAQAPPDKMMIIADAVQLLDVEANRGDSLDAYLARIQTYRLATLNPEEVVKILLETGGMDPTTQLRVDEDSRAIIASAPPWDHLTIQRLVKKLDGSARQFKVVRLRNLAADQVATTIEAMMVGPKEDNNSRRGFYYGYYGRNRDENKNKDKFRVGADVEYNRLLLWCNETELEEVMNLLEELGEIPSSAGNESRVRILESLPAEQEEELLRRLQEAFQSLAPNPVELPPAKSQDRGQDASPEIDALEPDSPVKEASRPSLNDGARTLLAQAPIRFAQYQGSPEGSARAAVDDRVTDRSEQAPPTAPPVRITRGSDGRLVVTCADPRALDILENLLEQIAPAQRDFQVFHLKHASAYWTALQLEDFFEDADDKKPRSRFTYYFYDYYNQDNNDKKRLGLDERPKLKFISETDTNTIIVRNATEDQLATVRQLIELYDIPEPVNNQSARFTKVIAVKYSRASAVAATIKDAFRDLLSGNDKAFQKKNGEEQQRNQRMGGGSFMRGFGDDDGSGDGPRATFKGKLSIGVDDSTNTLIITTEGEKLMELVTQMIEQLDDAAKPNDDVRVVSLPGGTSPTKVHEVFSRLFGEATGQPPQGQAPEKGERPDRENNERRRGEGRRSGEGRDRD